MEVEIVAVAVAEDDHHRREGATTRRDELPNQQGKACSIKARVRLAATSSFILHPPSSLVGEKNRGNARKHFGLQARNACGSRGHQIRRRLGAYIPSAPPARSGTTRGN